MRVQAGLPHARWFGEVPDADRAPDGTRIAFSVDQQGRSLLYVMKADGTDARMVTDALRLRGTPAWAPDGSAILSAADDRDHPCIFTIALDGRPASRLVPEYSVDPVWSPDGRFIVYSGPDIGTTFPVKAVSAEGVPYDLPSLTLSRGARLRFLPGRRALLVLRGDIQHRNL